MIVWGGYDVFFVPFGSGGRYNPASDSWTTTSTATAPPAVAFHTAVWTGSRMLVWGGKHAANNLTSQGGRYDPASDTWSATILAGAPTGRFGHTAVWTGSRMVIWGGTEIDDLDGVGVNTGARYDPVNDAWSATETSTAPTGRSWHTAVWTGQQMLVWGGTCCGNGALLIDGSRYEPLTNTWLAMTLTEAPAGRRYATAVWTGLEMIVWGGTGAGSRENTGGRYSLADDAWTSTTILGAPAARDVHTGTWAGDRMIVFGGNGAGGWPLASGGSYCACITLYQDADGDGWGGPLVALASCDGTIPPGYTLTQSDCNDGNTAIHPGALDSTCNGVDEDCNGYNDDLWIGGLSQCGLGVCHATGFFECINGQIVNNCTPGTPLDLFDINCNNLDEDCDGGVDEEYAQREDLWTPIASAPNTRTKHTTVWTGTEMIVFGGDNGSGTVKVGGEAYAPASNTWRGLAAGPLKRWRHTAVWTGSRMIVWGGDDNVATIYNTGSRYDPSTDTWAATTTTGAPAARLLHTAVWTGNGSRMVIWGGRDAMNFLGTGSRYDPVANSWSATTTTGAPAARWLHSAVWTGTEMIVWGGQATGALNSGSRYDPAGNTWTAVASAGSFAGRFGHVAVWTGTEMLVWGGTDGTSYFGNGGRYNPGTNSWSSMSSIGAPSQRAFASAVWTGSELIVWGGVDGTGGGDALEDGARYDPATNTWTDMSPVSAPNDRGRASGVWTDSELIVWGGDPNGNALGDGARYKPLTLCGTGGCQRTGSMVCSAGVASFQCLPQAPAPEVCNGLDDDCNVAIDDGIPVPSGHPVLILGKLASPSNASFSWDAVPGATGYDVVRGYLSTLRITGGDFTWAMQSCAFNDLAGTVMQDNVPPFPDDGYWYLVRAVNACSGNGTYDDVLPPQQGSRDAEINAAPNTCP
jgi:N-acetylneuraminic acid mutarotase